MAKKKDKVTETEVLTQEVQVEETQQEVVESVIEDSPVEETTIQEVVEVVEEPKPEEPTIEEVPQFQDKDIVTFYNKRGELRWAAYGYITKRGYKAIEKYKSKK